ncbi:MAG: acyl-CoA thioesterase [Clostridiales bacterium]
MFNTFVDIKFYDADPAGIMFFANAFKLAHSVYEQFVKSSPLSKDFFNNDSFVVPIMHSEADYFKPISPDLTLKASLEVSKLKESSFELTYVFCNNESREEYLRVKTVHVFVHKSSWKKMLIPVDFKKYLNDHIAI